MRYVERSPQPRTLASRPVADALNELRDQLDDTGRLRFKRSIWLGVKTHLEELFAGKCAFCELRLSDTYFGDVEHYRPKSAVVDLRGRTSIGYWWLAYEWNNLYLVCAECNRSKRNRFPVRGRRAESFEELETEQPYILDPCRPGDLAGEKHLVFSRERPRSKRWSSGKTPDIDEKYLRDNTVGMVAASSRRGEVTIDILSLNREPLRKTRALVIGSLYDTFFPSDPSRSADPSSRSPEFTDKLVEWLHPDYEHAGMIAQVLYGWFPDEVGKLLEAEGRLEFTSYFGRQQAQSLVEEYLEQSRKQQMISVEATTAHEKAVLMSTLRRIERVEIENFRGIDRLELDFPEPITDPNAPDGTRDREGWLALLGENGVGKSSVLQAVALALMGDRDRAELRQYRAQPQNVLSHGRSAGYVRVRLSGLTEPVELRFDMDRYESNFAESPVVLLGYGSTRLLRTADQEATEGDTGLVRLDNLFNPFARLNDVERWVADTQRVPSGRFKDIREALMDLLQLEPGSDDIFRRSGMMRIRHAEGRTEYLGELSDGYASVVALALDIMLVLSTMWSGTGSIRNAEGVVLLDEIGVHLHPRWQMEIVSRLRYVFPNLQFITTTHQPLCLQGLTAGEVVLMDRDEDDRIYAVSDLPSPSDLRAEQLLRSPFFGLHSTVSTEVDRLFTDYYSLLAKSSLTAAERKRLKGLKNELHGRRHLGDSVREELMYEVIDRLIASSGPKATLEDLPALKKEAVAEVREVWQEHLAAMRGSS